MEMERWEKRMEDNSLGALYPYSRSERERLQHNSQGLVRGQFQYHTSTGTIL